MNLVESIQALDNLLEKKSVKKKSVKKKSVKKKGVESKLGTRSFKPDEARIWPDRDTVDYWKTIPHMLHIGFHGDETEGAGAPVAGPSSMISAQSPLSKRWIDKLPKGSHQAKAAEKPGMTMGALRVISTVFGDDDVQDSIDEAKAFFKGKTISGGTAKSGRLSHGGVSVGMGYLKQKNPKYEAILGKIGDHFGTPKSAGPRAFNLLLKTYGAGGDVGESHHTPNAEGAFPYVDGDGKINKKNILRALHGPLKRNGKKVPTSKWTKEDLNEVDEVMKGLVRDMYAVNQFAMSKAEEAQKRRIKKTGQPSNVNAYIVDGRVLVSRGTNKLSGLSHTSTGYGSPGYYVDKKISNQLTAQIATTCIKYNCGVQTSQRPLTGFSLGPGNAAQSGLAPNDGKRHGGQWNLPTHRYVAHDMTVVRTSFPNEAILLSHVSDPTGAQADFDYEAELFPMGSAETLMKIASAKTHSMAAKISKEDKAILNSQDLRLPPPPGATTSSKEENIKAFTPGALPFKGYTVKPTGKVDISSHDFDPQRAILEDLMRQIEGL